MLFSVVQDGCLKITAYLWCVRRRYGWLIFIHDDELLDFAALLLDGRSFGVLNLLIRCEFLMGFLWLVQFFVSLCQSKMHFSQVRVCIPSIFVRRDRVTHLCRGGINNSQLQIGFGKFGINLQRLL